MFKYKMLFMRSILNIFQQKPKSSYTLSSDLFKLAKEVSGSLLNHKPVVALESTVITHGLPYPENLEYALSVEEIVRRNGATPATIGILNGRIHIGMEFKEIEILANLKNAIKISRRDLPYVISKKMSGGTTVAGTMILSHKAGIFVFATGGIGGVHRGAETSMDVSADLYELSRTPMTVVSAGVKSILDIGLTLEYLETLGVCIATFGNSKVFPSFFTEKSDFNSPYNVETVVDAAQLICSRDNLQLNSGILLAVPIPEKYKEDGEKAHSVIEEALKEAENKQISGKNVTPFVLEKVHLFSEGASLRANIGLLENNALVASQVAVELNKLKSRGGSNSSRTMFSPVKHEARNIISSSKPVVIGGCILDIHVKVLEDIKMDGRTISGKVQSTAGGVARNVSDCMARLDANPCFISLVGGQEYAETLLSKMEHMDTGAIKLIQKARTATCVVVLDNYGECAFVVGDMNIHDYLSPDQVERHREVIEVAPMVIIDGNIPLPTINYIMRLCSKHGVPIWFEPTDVSRASRPFQFEAWRSTIAYASPNLNELKIMHDTIFRNVTAPLQDDCLERKIEDSLRLGVPLLSNSLHTVIVTLASHGILLLTSLPIEDPFPMGRASPTRGKVTAVHYPATAPDNIVSVSGAGDCFAGGMISAILRGLTPRACIAAGQRAAALSLTSHHSVPNSMAPDVVFGSDAVPYTVIL